jgi:hypothetical protein
MLARSKLLFVPTCAAAVAKLESKFLNNRTESRGTGLRHKFPDALKIFHKFFTFDCRQTDFSKRLPLLWG